MPKTVSLLLILLIFCEIKLLGESFDQQNRKEKIRISVSGGLGYLIGNTKSAEQALINIGNEKGAVSKYYNRLKTGWQGGTTLHYLMQNGWGAGIEYLFFTTKSQMMGSIDSGNSFLYGSIREKIYTNFLGPSLFYCQKSPGEKYLLYSSLSFGWVFYRDEVNLVAAPALITGNAPGLLSRIGIEAPLIRSVSADLNISGFYSALNKYSLNDGQTKTTVSPGTKENLSRINLSAGIKYVF
jgi:hypothetical protein